MGGRVRGLWPFAAIGAIAAVTVAGLVLVGQSRNPAQLESYVGFALSVTGVATGWIAWVWRARRQQASGVLADQDLVRLADVLAGAVDQQWTRAAGERGLLEPEPIPVKWRPPAAPFAGPVAAAVASTRFAPLPGLAAVGEQRLQAGQVSELHEVYGALGSGRLVIAGGPGSGKSGAALLLILAALRYRRSIPETIRSEVPVPVMFTLHGWDPRTRRARDWLAERLWQTYPLFAGKHGAGAARVLLDAGRIAVILDGLDEIPEDLRPAVLQALSQHATFRLVLLTRSAEMADAVTRAMLQGAAAIELQDIDAGAAADYLTRTQLDPPPHGWHELTSWLRREPGSPLARALSNPLMLTLVRDTYRGRDDIGELLGLRDADGRPASSQNITDHLLDRVLPAAYTPQPGEPPPRYDLPAAEHALRCIATRMNKDGTRDLQWWHVPAWAPATPRFVATCLGVGLAAALAFGLMVGFGFGFGLGFGLRFGLRLGIGFGIVAGIAFGRGNKIPKRVTPVRWRQLFRRGPLVVGLLVGAVTGIFGFAVFHALGDSWAAWAGLGAWFLVGLVAWLGAGLVAGMSRPGTDDTSPLSPRSSWRSDRAFGLVAGVVPGLLVGFVGGLGVALLVANGGPLAGGWLGLVVNYLSWGIGFWLAAGFGVWLAVGLVYPQSWSSSLAFAQLAASDRTPVRLMRFLEDARRRGVLRTVGPVYQFRHARLQDRLAALEPATGPGLGKPHLAAGDAAPPAASARP